MSTLFADIASGNVDAADVMFLVAFIVAVVAVVAVAAALVPAGAKFVQALMAAALALVSFGFLLL